METNEKLGKVVWDGRLYDLDSMSLSELNKLLDAVEKEEGQLQNALDRLMEEGDEK